MYLRVILMEIGVILMQYEVLRTSYMGRCNNLYAHNDTKYASIYQHFWSSF